MTGPAGTLERRVAVALADDFLRRSVRFTVERLREGKRAAADSLGEWEAWRERGAAIRAHTIAHLDGYLDRFSRACEAAGGRVHFAADAAEASRIVLDLARSRGADLVAKSKSMVSEEVGVNHALHEAGVRCVETDLGEWIIQLARETPSHIIIPAIHKTRGQIRALFEADGGKGLTDDTGVLTAYARGRLREAFATAGIGMTGCNFGVAQTGSVVLFTNEGNGRMVSTLPRVHVVMMGMERIVPTWEDLEVMVNLLPRSATGQKITTYVTAVTGPRRGGEADGPDELHVVVLDNGRSRQLGDPAFQSILHCIRCGACLNVCPVYRQIGGHAYGSVYPGPIGAVLTPLLLRDRAATELANASSLCGACAEACPVKIPLHEQLVTLRRRRVEAGFTGAGERLAMRLFGLVFASAGRVRWLGRLARFGGGIVARLAAGFLGPGRAWARFRTPLAPAPRSFRDLWDEELGRG